jgi:hypothetical protein
MTEYEIAQELALQRQQREQEAFEREWNAWLEGHLSKMREEVLTYFRDVMEQVIADMRLETDDKIRAALKDALAAREKQDSVVDLPAPFLRGKRKVG